MDGSPPATRPTTIETPMQIASVAGSMWKFGSMPITNGAMSTER